MQALADRDYFTDFDILRDPYAYFEAVRERGPVTRMAGHDVVIVTGYAEVLDVLRNHADYSSVLAPQGPAAPLPFQPQGSDITPQIEAHRLDFIGGDLLVAYDDQPHTFSRSLISRLFTPSRLKANEEFMADYADRLVREMVANGGCDLIKEVATPFVTMVIADLLGVPPADRQLFMDAIDAGVGAGSLNPEDLEQQNAPLILMGMYFNQYVADRRANPRDDVLSELSHAKYPDDTTPDLMEIVRLATFLFAAGQDTSAKLLGNTMRHLIENPQLQQQMRENPSQISALLEEVLRLEGSTKMTARLARVDTRIGDVEIPAGTKVFLALAAANRDPRRWESPDQLILNRPKIVEHVAFGRGAHVCAGAPLARVEVRVILEKFLHYTKSIDLAEATHGPAGARKLDYEPSFIIRGLSKLDVTLEPSAAYLASNPAPAPAAADAPAKEKRGFFGFGRRAKETSKATHYSTADTKIGVLLATPETRAVVDAHLPEVTADPRISMAKSMTFRLIQKFASDVFTDDVLDAMDADLKKIPVH